MAKTNWGSYGRVIDKSVQSPKWRNNRTERELGDFLTKATILGQPPKARKAPASSQELIAREMQLIEAAGGEAPKPPGGTPRYLTLAKTLQDAIQNGTYPIGSLLPTEVDMAGQYGVSRQTVRQAISLLRQQNLLSARKGVGTRVEAKTGMRRFSYSAASISDLLELAHDSELSIETQEQVVARGPLATELGCRSGHRWLRLGCIRNIDGELKPLSWIDVYIDGRAAPNIKLPRTMRTALFLFIEKQTGEIFSEIQQEIRATVVDENVAERLGAEVGSPALQITRRYFSTGRRLVQVAVNIFPADRFFYSVAINRD